MTTIVTRSGKGSALSWVEADANLTNLNTDKLEASDLAAYETSVHAAATYAPIATTVTDSDIGVTVQAYSANLAEYAAVNPTAAGLALLDDADASAQRTTLGLGTAATSNAGDFQAADADIPTISASQAEMEAGSETALRSMSPLRVAQAIAALAPPGIGSSQTWQNVLGSRTSGTTYTNSSGKPIMVCVNTLSVGAGSTALDVVVSGVAIQSNSVYGNGAGYSASVSFIVPNGATYSAAGYGSGGGSLSKWTELR